MLHLVLDTNVWISAFLTRGGLCEKLVRAPRKDILRFIASEFILREVETVLSGKLHMPPKVVEERLKYIVRNSVVVEPVDRLEVVRDCEGDNRILECAVAGRASYLVTGDKNHLLPLGRFEGIEIVTPRRMVELLKL